MKASQSDDLIIVNTTNQDLVQILWLFEQAMRLQGKNGYKVWTSIDETGLKNDIENGLQYKIVKENDILCIFSIQFADPFIWGQRDQEDAIYLHRIVVNPLFKGQKLFEKVLTWTKQFGLRHNLKYVRMDTWADNKKIIGYYTSFGFQFIGNYKTPDTPELPVQNRNLDVALLEMKLSNE